MSRTNSQSQEQLTPEQQAQQMQEMFWEKVKQQVTEQLQKIISDFQLGKHIAFIRSLLFARYEKLSLFWFEFFFIGELVGLWFIAKQQEFQKQFEDEERKDSAIKGFLGFAESAIDVVKEWDFVELVKIIKHPNFKMIAALIGIFTFILLIIILTSWFLNVTFTLTLILLPGFIHAGYHRTLKNFFSQKIWPPIKPLWDQKIQPFVDAKIKPHLKFTHKQNKPLNIADILELSGVQKGEVKKIIENLDEPQQEEIKQAYLSMEQEQQVQVQQFMLQNGMTQDEIDALLKEHGIAPDYTGNQDKE
ncbi:MAG: hypothetical protein EZS28_025175 [Streblomastix strix]|uniref:Uncharacterized protein n=1 Tax=Streblomastix strix TaxID=222440 RepID=A0A5J4V9Q7_9EUKA|nr:MAG: hypothetical protein EZS28_025175 [Streblomastix strix]